MDRPFCVLGVQQIAVGAPVRDRLHHLWVDLLGMTPTGFYRSESENVDEEIVSVGEARGKVEFDLMQPLDSSRKPVVDQPALNHLGLWVDDLPAAMQWLAAKGVRFASGGIRKGASGHMICFIHPNGDPAAPLGGEGVLIELVQAPAELGGRGTLAG